ncbi:hypothetical protein G6L26_007575 [Agrobacterium radiobacter]|uniref:hypothetical protein n=1 Tax=Agrobacterium tumefaciens complex TaxID=1183400 RepID=UPI0007614458|nr:hypothetical protein [Agrobacterium tumefaciens]KWT88038.1 hypothetical protein ASB65_18575 [Agrobacterium tumefaciens str. B6]MQB28164.1 hypothetical protein [Agrobacterium tumefaciens]NTA05031.1 hypothetical protein [Agrobacterium tumefaciens]NTA91626.1 hypothetical protein [Agrobacterium tumefaciens]NTB12776.1 hypothetical protein [Agrobacterium tumefaciens]
MSEEQRAFESWAEGKRHDMSCHPLHYLFLNAETNAAREGWNAALRYLNGQLSSPVAYRCKDFADGWILYHDGKEAKRYQEQTGCLMQSLCVSLHSDDDTQAFPPEPEELCRDASKAIVADLNGRLSKFVIESGMMGLQDTIRSAVSRIENLTSSYLEACAENDRLRASQSHTHPTN